MKLSPFTRSVLDATTPVPMRAGAIAESIGATTVNTSTALNKLVDAGLVEVSEQKGSGLPLFRRRPTGSKTEEGKEVRKC